MNEPMILGTAEEKNFGNTAFIQSADACIRQMASVALPDSHKTLVEVQKKNPAMSVVETKQAILSGALKAFIGVHSIKKLKHLDICEEKLRQVGINGDAPVAFWEQEVPVSCLLREVGIRALSAKPSSTAVERLWNAFGDNLTAKRRSLKNSTLAQLVYAKMNICLLDSSIHEQNVPAEFGNVLEFIDTVIEQEIVDGLDGDGPQECADMVHESDSLADSGSGDAEEWL
jgi:hypothetical protein